MAPAPVRRLFLGAYAIFSESYELPKEGPSQIPPQSATAPRTFSLGATDLQMAELLGPRYGRHDAAMAPAAPGLRPVEKRREV